MTIGLADARGALPMGKRLRLSWQQISRPGHRDGSDRTLTMQRPSKQS